MSALSISNKSSTLEYFLPCLNGPVKVRLDSNSSKSIQKSHKTFSHLLKNGEKIYGVTTGFGDLSSIPIDVNDQRKLQLNLIRSHATGVGKSFDPGITRIIMLLTIDGPDKDKRGNPESKILTAVPLI